jgi:hypothetical protein
MCHDIHGRPSATSLFIWLYPTEVLSASRSELCKLQVKKNVQRSQSTQNVHPAVDSRTDTIMSEVVSNQNAF